MQEGASETEYFVCRRPGDPALSGEPGRHPPARLGEPLSRPCRRPTGRPSTSTPRRLPFADVIEVAPNAIHRLCESIELPCFAKTSGATGLHVLIPLGGKCTYAQSRQLAEVIARIVTTELRDVCTIARAVAKREGRVYVDYLQNGYGKLLVAPYSVRARPGATVSTPLAWDEVKEGLDPRDFTIETVPPRLEGMKEDHLRPVLELEPDLTEILGRLAEKL